MKRKSIINQLKLAYSPLSNYEFTILKKDKIIERIIDEASLYVIAQRAVISFENLIPLEDEFCIKFEIHQRGNPEKLKCKLPLNQVAIGSENLNNIGIAFNFIDKSQVNTELPHGNLHAFSLVELRRGKKEFLVWFSPEKLLQNWWNGFIDCEIEGDFKAFLNYKIHYVGKATKQSIFKRLTGHSTLQDILSLECPITYKDLPTQEIVILCFGFSDNLQVQSFGDNSSEKEMVDAVLCKDIPEKEFIFLDAEKALIKAMQPSYNKEMFNNYPISKDGLYKEDYNLISYTFIDPITLKYEYGDIKGGLSRVGGDTITVKNNNSFELIKH